MRIKDLDILELLGGGGCITPPFYHRLITRYTKLDNLTVGAYLDIVDSNKPSDIISIIKKDLGIPTLLLPEHALCYLYINHWKRQIESYTQAFINTSRLVIIPNKYQVEWGEVISKIQIPSEISLVDHLAKRMNISWDEAIKIKVSQVILMQRLDLQEQYFQYLINKNMSNKK